MSDDPLDYEVLAEKAKRGIVREALAVVARQGLTGEHFFHITFRTDHADVRIPQFLRLQYPEEMAIILQNVFQDLEVGEDSFSVTLSFNQVLQQLTIPFEAIVLFQDPSAEFAIGFVHPSRSGEAGAEDDTPLAADEVTSEAELPAEDEESAPATEREGNVIKVDRFRKR